MYIFSISTCQGALQNSKHELWRCDRNWLKVALSQKILENFYIANINIPYLSWAENLNFLPKTVNNLFNFPVQDSDLEYVGNVKILQYLPT